MNGMEGILPGTVKGTNPLHDAFACDAFGVSQM